MSSDKAEVIVDASGKWVVNTLTFKTREAAEHYAKTRQFRWTAMRDTRVVEVDPDFLDRIIKD